MNEKNKPDLIIVGGANGSGKTTFAREIVAQTGIEYLGADEIAAELNPAAPGTVAIEAARIFSRRFDEYLNSGKSVLVESTLSGLSLKKFLRAAKEHSFRIRIWFVYLDSAEMCIRRIASRVAKGGHHVPDEDVRRRFGRANANFWNVYKNSADKWHLIFNAGDSFEQIAAGDDNGVIILDEARARTMAEKGGKLNGTVSDETLREMIEFQRIGNDAVHKAQEENRRLGIPNWYSINGKIVSDQEISNDVSLENSAECDGAVPKR